MNPEEILIRAFDEPSMGKVGLYIVKRLHGTVTHQGVLTWKEVEPFSRTPPVVYLESDEAQRLVDSLWEAGLRPAQGHGTAGQLDATRSHLDDMRAIVAGKLKIALPEHGRKR